MANLGTLLLVLALFPVSCSLEWQWSPLDYPHTSLSERQEHVTTRIHHAGQSDASSGIVTQSEKPVARDSVRLVEVPQQLWAGSKLVGVVFYCSANQVLGLEVLVTTHMQVGVAVYRKSWRCPGPLRGVRWARVRVPDPLVYRRDRSLRRSVPVEGAIALAKDYRVLSALPPLARPSRPPRACLAWAGLVKELAQPEKEAECPALEEPAVLLAFPLALSGSHAGLARRLPPVPAREMELARQRHLRRPRAAYSLDLLVRDACRYAFCSIVQRVNASDSYATPLVFLTPGDKLHVQVELVTGEASAVQTTFRLPLKQWVRLHLALDDRQMTISIAYGNNLEFSKEMVHYWPRSVSHDDTAGLLMVGGGQHTQGIVGYVSRVRLYRTRSVPMETDGWLGPVERDIATFESSCQQLHRALPSLQEQQQQHVHTHPASSHGSCPDAYARLFARRTPPGTCDAREPIAKRHKALVALLSRRAYGRRGNKDLLLSTVPLAKDLYILARSRLIGQKRPGTLVTHWLRQAGCLGQPQALFLLAVAYQVGLGVPANQTEALVLGLLAAGHGCRLAQARLGYKHQRGLDGHEGDLGAAYAYYSDAAVTTSRQRQEHHPDQVYVELVRLNDEAGLREQTRPDHDLFLWLKHQARQGVGGAQQTLGRMLYWGQQGLARNVAAAARYYERSAVETRDPTAMYDYAIVLLKGQGVKQNLSLAREYLEKAAAEDLPQAHNALGWYHQTYGGDYSRAVSYWHRADALGNPDAPHNLGYVYSSGLYPGNASRQHAVAYAHYWRSAQRGHIDGAIRCAEYWALGNGESAPLSMSSAVIWTRWVAEQSGDLGSVLRLALDAYLRYAQREALLFYLMAAESGYEGAQFNVAYLAYTVPDQLSNVTEMPLAWRYFNLSSLEDNAATYSRVRMGDYHYYGLGTGGRDLKAAAEAYGEAARTGDPEGLYSLGSLLEEQGREGRVPVPRAVWDSLAVPRADRHTARSLTNYLYTRCRDHHSEEALLPCSLALARTQLHDFLKHHHHSCLQGGNVLGIAVVTALTIITLLAKLRDWAGTQASPSSLRHAGLNGGLPLANGSANRERRRTENSQDFPENSQDPAGLRTDAQQQQQQHQGESGIPKIPDERIPRIPDEVLPGIPDDGIPRIPDDEIPRNPEVGISEISEGGIPGIPGVNSQDSGNSMRQQNRSGMTVVGVLTGIMSGVLVWIWLI